MPERDARASGAQILGWLAAGATALASAIGCGALSYVHFAVRPGSDAAAGISLLGVFFAVLGDLVAVALAIAALILGWRARAFPPIAWIALALAITSAAAVPLVWLVWTIATAPVFVH